MSEYTAYREGYSDGFYDGVEFMQKQFVKNCEETERKRAERYSKWIKRYKDKNKGEDKE